MSWRMPRMHACDLGSWGRRSWDQGQSDPTDLHSKTYQNACRYVHLHVWYVLCTQICVSMEKSGKQMKSQVCCFYIFFPCISQYFLQWTCDTFVINSRRTFWYTKKKIISSTYCLSLPPTLTVPELLGTKLLTSRWSLLRSTWSLLWTSLHSVQTKNLKGCSIAANTACMSSWGCHDKVSPTRYFKQQKFIVSQSGATSLSLRCWQRWFLWRAPFFMVLLSKHSLFSLPVCVQISSLYGTWMILDRGPP